MTESGPDFNRLLMTTINQSLQSVLGKDTAKGLIFYLDTNIAVADPGRYAKSIEKMFGAGATPLLDKILNDLSSKTGVPRENGKSFKEVVVLIRLTFQDESKAGQTATSV